MEQALSGLIVKAEGGNRLPPIEPGTYPAVCYGVVDIGVQYSAAFDKSSRKVIVMWEIPSETVQTEDGEKPRIISETYTASIGEKANLRKDLEAWRGKPFSEDELKGFSLANIIGAGCMLNIIHKESKSGGTFAKVSAIVKLPKGIPTPAGTMEKLVFDLSDPVALDKLSTLPEWVQNRIKESETYKSMTTEFEEVPADEAGLPWENGGFGS